jgi:hypothetical protein
MAAAAAVINRMAEATVALGEATEVRATELKALAPEQGMQPDMKAVKRITNGAADDFNLFVERMLVEIPAFREKLTVSFDAFGKLAVVTASDFTEGVEEVRKILPQVIEFLESAKTAREGIGSFRGTIASLPRMTTIFNHAKRRAVATLDGLMGDYESAIQQAQDVIELLESIVDGRKGPSH